MTTYGPQVTQFKSVYDFLDAYIKFRTESDRKWNLTRWVRQLELSSLPHLSMILNRKRRMSPVIIQKFLKYFRFNAKERLHFIELVNLSHLDKDSALFRSCYMRVKEKGHSFSYDRRLGNDEFMCLSNWYYFAIREMLNLGIKLSRPQDIGRRLLFPVSINEISYAIDTMLRIGLMERGRNGTLNYKGGSVETTEDIASRAITSYQKQVSHLAGEASRFASIPERELTSTTLCVSEQDLFEIKSFLRSFKVNFIEKFERSPGNRVYQLNLQFYPLTRPAAEGV